MTQTTARIALIPGDGIGPDVTHAAFDVIEAARAKTGGFDIEADRIDAGAACYLKHGVDIEPDGEERAGEADAILLGAIGLPSVRHKDGTEISPHLRLRDRYGLYAGIRPVKAYPNAPQRLSDPRAAALDLVILRESTEGLFYTAAANGGGEMIGDAEARDTLRITRKTTEKLHDFAFRLAQKRKSRGGKGHVTCVDKANVFVSMAFFRRIFDERRTAFPDIGHGYNYVDAMALDLVRKPWEFDVLVMENMFGDILSDLAGGLVGGMGMASCGEIGDSHGLFQGAHGSAPDIMGQDKANPLATILSGALMLDYLSGKLNLPQMADAARMIENAVDQGFQENRLRPMEFGGDMGTQAVTGEVIAILNS